MGVGLGLISRLLKVNLCTARADPGRAKYFLALPVKCLRLGLSLWWYDHGWAGSGQYTSIGNKHTLQMIYYSQRDPE
jgi:hypothetical protein